MNLNTIMTTATNNLAIPAPVLQEFVKATTEIKLLLADASRAETRQDATAITAWVSNAQVLLSRTGSRLRPGDSWLAALKATPEFQEYRKQLHLLCQAVESLQQELMAHSQILRGQQQQITRTRSWAAAVSKLG
jgi:hypothetical protein